MTKCGWTASSRSRRKYCAQNIFIPAPKTSLTLISSRHGYTARRCGETGPVPGRRGRRIFSNQGLLARNEDLRISGRGSVAHKPAQAGVDLSSSPRVKTTEAGRSVRHYFITFTRRPGRPGRSLAKANGSNQRMTHNTDGKPPRERLPVCSHNQAAFCAPPNKPANMPSCLRTKAISRSA
jgi:hypothetical protein